MKTTPFVPLALALGLALLPGAGCADDDSGSGSEGETSASSATSTAGEEAASKDLCEGLCAEPAPATICGDAPSDCVETCAALGSAACLTCRIDQADLGWTGMMTCGFTPCSFSDVAGYDACAASCDPETATCEFSLGGEVTDACADACGA